MLLKINLHSFRKDVKGYDVLHIVNHAMVNVKFIAFLVGNSGFFNKFVVFVTFLFLPFWHHFCYRLTNCLSNDISYEFLLLAI